MRLRAGGAPVAAVAALTALTTGWVGAGEAGAAIVLPPLGTRVTGEIVAAWGPGMVADNSSSTQCMGGSTPIVVAYRTDRIVVRSTATNTQIQAQVNNTIRAIGASGRAGDISRLTFPTPPTGGAITPVEIVNVSSATSSPLPIVRLARALNAQGVITAASPDYALSPESGPTGMWPNGFPQPAAALTPPRTRATGGVIGEGIQTWLFDTGLPSARQAAIPSNLTKLATGDNEILDHNADGIVDLYYGAHSVAIAGIMKTLAPGVQVKVGKITEANGVATDDAAAKRMMAALAPSASSGVWPGIVLNAFGTPACDVDPRSPGTNELVPLATQAVTEFVARWGRTTIVAAAGNRSTSRRFWPAAAAGVISAGAMDTTVDSDGSPWTSASRTGPRPSFSNFGTWVDGWAPGKGLITYHVNGLRFTSSQPVLKGKAVVDGTSFAAPYLASLIAERMRDANQKASVAWTAVRASGPACKASIGGGPGLALTTFSSAATTKAELGTTPAC